MPLAKYGLQLVWFVLSFLHILWQ